MIKKHALSLAFIACAASCSGWAQIPVDLTRSTFTNVTATKFQIDNLNVPGVGNFQLSFEWNPAAARFEPVVTSLRPNGDTCTTAVLKGSTSSSTNLAGYVYSSRVNANGEFGGIQTRLYPASELTLVWAKTATADLNPYLVGRVVTNFDPSKGYGVVGEASSGAYPGFTTGDFIEVTGSPDKGAVSIVKVGTASSITMPLALSSDFGGGQVLTPATNCAPVAASNMTGNLASPSNDSYVFASTGVNAGSIAPSSTRSFAFSTSWGSVTAPAGFRKAAVGYGIMGATSSSYYTNFTANQTIFGVDIGSGIAIGGVDSNGKVISAAVFIRP
ncbi:MAG: hypothetical protein CFE44_09260 [Burkholderiales bacterium PBB4]|nr:MAG: hypothetical protein CFE44_09260 [Burkholderiales bacterium PBB4]